MGFSKIIIIIIATLEPVGCAISFEMFKINEPFLSLNVICVETLIVSLAKKTHEKKKLTKKDKFLTKKKNKER